MPSKKGYKKNNFSRYAGYTKSTLGIASQALNIALATKKLLNVEYKATTTNGVALAIPDGVGTITQFTNMVEGNTATTRTGNQIKVTSLQFRAEVVLHASAVNTMFSIFIIRDNQTNEAVYETSDFLASTANAISVISPTNFNNQSRFRVLKRWTFTLNQDSNSTRILKLFMKLQEIIRYDGNTGDIEDLTKNSISMLVISDQPTNVPAMTFHMRLRYVDN